MKKYLGVILGLFLLLVTSGAYAATNLNAGDIVITTAHSDGVFSTGSCPNPSSTNNAFEFLNLVDIDSGTVIYFTDNGYTSTGSWRGTEGTIVFTATNFMPAGTFTYYSDCALVAEPLKWSRVGGWDPANAGDNLIAYQGVLGGTGTSVDFLYAIGYAGATTWITTGAITSNNSYLPAGLSLGTTAVAITPGARRNVQYLCPAITNIYESDFLSVVSNSANWTGGGAGVSYSTLSGSCSVIPQYDLQLTKTLMPLASNYLNSGYVHIGSLLQFSITAIVYNNTGYNILVSDYLPSGLQYISSSVSTGVYNSGTRVWSLGKVVSGQVHTLSMDAVLQSTGYITNTITGGFSGIDTSLINNQAAISFTGVERDAAIIITQSTGNFVSGDIISYTLDYHYSGSIAMTGDIFIAIPSNVIFQSSSLVGTIISGGVLRTGIYMIPGTISSIVVTGTVIGNSGDVFTTTGFIGDDVYCLSRYMNSGDSVGCLELYTGNNISDTVAHISPITHDISVTITGEQTIWGGYPLSYTIVVLNAGPNTGYNINLDIQKTGPLQINISPIAIPTLGVGESFYYTLTGWVSTGIATGTIYSITAISSSSGVDPILMNNTALFSGTISNYIYGFAGGGGYEPPILNGSTAGSGISDSGANIFDTLPISEKNIFNSDIQNGLCYTRNIGGFTGNDLVGSYKSIQELEFASALMMLYSYELTQYKTTSTFGGKNMLTREQAAKMFSQFAINVLCRQPSQDQPAYKDYVTADTTLKPYITLAYQLGLMRGNPQSGMFRPQDPITNQEFNAVLVRMLLARYLPEDDTQSWSSHYDNIAQNLSITVGDSNYILRYNAALMFFRAYKNQNYIYTDIGYVLKNK